MAVVRMAVCLCTRDGCLRTSRRRACAGTVQARYVQRPTDNLQPVHGAGIILQLLVCSVRVVEHGFDPPISMQVQLLQQTAVSIDFTLCQVLCPMCTTHMYDSWRLPTLKLTLGKHCFLSLSYRRMCNVAKTVSSRAVSAAMACRTAAMVPMSALAGRKLQQLLRGRLAPLAVTRTGSGSGHRLSR